MTNGGPSVARHDSDRGYPEARQDPQAENELDALGDEQPSSNPIDQQVGAERPAGEPERRAARSAGEKHGVAAVLALAHAVTIRPERSRNHSRRATASGR